MKAIVPFARNLAPCILLFFASFISMAQESQQGHEARGPQHPTKLRDLIAEAERNNPEIAAAEDGYRAATYLAAQKSSLPDTQVTLQQFSVGSPRPFAGYTNSERRNSQVPVSLRLPLSLPAFRLSQGNRADARSSATVGAGTEKCPRPQLDNRQHQASRTLRKGGSVLPVVSGALNIENPTGYCTRD